MKRTILILMIFAFVSCSKESSVSILGEWMTAELVYDSDLGRDTVNMVGANEFYRFRDDNTLYITNGVDEVNAHYIIRDNELLSFSIGSFDTNRMEIIELTRERLSIYKKMPEFTDTRLYINLIRN